MLIIKFVFSNLLNNVSEGIEISYNSAGVLAHLVSDGVEAWANVKTSRDYVMSQIINVIVLKVYNLIFLKFYKFLGE